MADAPAPLTFQRDFDPQTGEAIPVAPGVLRVTAPNSGPFTFTGTNSFVIGEDEVALVDPGPVDAAHEAALQRAIGGRNLRAIILTHTHRDHSASADHWRGVSGAPIWSGGPHRLSRPARLFEVNAIRRDCDFGLMPERVFFDGESFAVGGVTMTAIATPGHCANHFAFGLEDSDVLTGDHVMGWNSTLVAVPDGAMGDYLASLRALLARPYRRYIPSHGGPIADGPAYGQALLAHRLLRNSQITSAVEAGARTMGDLLARIYPDLTGKLRFSAAMTLTAHIEYLESEGALRVRRTPLGLRVRRA